MKAVIMAEKGKEKEKQKKIWRNECQLIDFSFLYLFPYNSIYAFLHRLDFTRLQSTTLHSSPLYSLPLHYLPLPQYPCFLSHPAPSHLTSSHLFSEFRTHKFTEINTVSYETILFIYALYSDTSII